MTNCLGSYAKLSNLLFWHSLRISAKMMLHSRKLTCSQGSYYILKYLILAPVR